MPVATTRPKILGIGYPRYAIPEWKELAESYDIHYFVPTVRKQVISEVKRLCEEEGPFVAAYVLFGTSGYSPFHEDMLAPLFTTPGHCGLFAQGGAGYDDVAWEWLAEQGCYLSNTPDAVTEATADMAVILMLNILRGTTEAEMNVRAGKWRDGLGLTKDPAGLTLGIIGLGSIGKSMATKVPQFGMNVIYHNRNQLSADEEERLGVKYASFDDVLSTADVISLNCPLTPATRGLIGAAEIAKMKDGVFIVNTARGAVIDEEALIAGLKSGKVARAGLDVLANEPCAESWLFSSPKVTLQPHVGAFTEGTILRGERAVLANVKKFLETGVPETPVNKPVTVSA